VTDGDTIKLEGTTYRIWGIDAAESKQACADGWMAFTRYSSDYVSQERAAIGAGLGVHAHDCEKPWDWRARNRATAKRRSPELGRRSYVRKATVLARLSELRNERIL
jgi:endonuclease YncB( thermonuclease family)